MLCNQTRLFSGGLRSELFRCSLLSTHLFLLLGQQACLLRFGFCISLLCLLCNQKCFFSSGLLSTYLFLLFGDQPRLFSGPFSTKLLFLLHKQTCFFRCGLRSELFGRSLFGACLLFLLYAY